MKKILLIIILSCLTLSGFAQENLQEKGSITIRTGLSIPHGDFSNKTLNNEKYGLADQGFHIAAEYTKFIDNYFGISMTFGLRRNPVNLEESNKKTAPSQYYAFTDWRTNYLLANAIFKCPLAPVLALYIKVGGGATFNTYPDISLDGVKNTDPEFLPKATGLAYGLGSGIKWQRSKMGVNFEVYSLYTEATFEIYRTLIKYELNAVNYSFGLSYKIL